MITFYEWLEIFAENDDLLSIRDKFRDKKQKREKELQDIVQAKIPVQAKIDPSKTWWTIKSWSRHTPPIYEGLFDTEQEAFVAARRLRDNLKNSGIYFSAVKAPIGSLDQLSGLGTYQPEYSQAWHGGFYGD